MKNALILAVILIAGCVIKPEPIRPDPIIRGMAAAAPAALEPYDQEMVLDKQVQPMSRNEVITAVRECEVNQLRAVMIYGKRKVNGFTTDIVLDVTCAPKFNPMF